MHAYPFQVAQLSLHNLSGYCGTNLHLWLDDSLPNGGFRGTARGGPALDDSILIGTFTSQVKIAILVNQAKLASQTGNLIVVGRGILIVALRMKDLMRMAQYQRSLLNW